MDTLTHHPFHYKANPRKMEESAAQKKRPRHAPGRKSFAFVIVISTTKPAKSQVWFFFSRGCKKNTEVVFMPGLTPVFHPDVPQTLARLSRRAGLPLTAAQAACLRRRPCGAAGHALRQDRRRACAPVRPRRRPFGADAPSKPRRRKDFVPNARKTACAARF